MAWNQSSSNYSKKPASGSKKLSPAVKGVLALILVWALGSLVWWFVSSGDDVQPVAKAPKAPKALKEVQAAKAGEARSCFLAEDPSGDSNADRERLALRERVKTMTAEERRQFQLEYFRKKDLDLTPTTNHPFRTGLELSLARIFSTQLGDPPPPMLTTYLPIHDEARLAEILAASNPVIAGDSERIRDAKEMVELAKRELRAYLSEGGDTETFLQFYHSKLVDAHQKRMEYAKEIVRVAREDPDIAREFLEEANRKLEAEGIKPVEIPLKAKLKLGLED